MAEGWCCLCCSAAFLNIFSIWLCTAVRASSKDFSLARRRTAVAGASRPPVSLTVTEGPPPPPPRPFFAACDGGGGGARDDSDDLDCFVMTEKLGPCRFLYYYCTCLGLLRYRLSDPNWCLTTKTLLSFSPSQLNRIPCTFPFSSESLFLLPALKSPEDQAVYFRGMH